MSSTPSLGRQAVFLDRDGTLIVDPGYLSDPDEVEVYLGVIPGLKMLSDAGYLLIVVTNQSGIARGFYTHEIVAALHQRIRDKVGQGGVTIDDFYYCPHMPEDKCACRKPGTELFLRAATEHGIDLGASAVIGNMRQDVEAGQRLGLLTAYVRTPGFHLDPDPGGGFGATIVARTFPEACERIIAHDQTARAASPRFSKA